MLSLLPLSSLSLLSDCHRLLDKIFIVTALSTEGSGSSTSIHQHHYHRISLCLHFYLRLHCLHQHHHLSLCHHLVVGVVVKAVSSSYHLVFKFYSRQKMKICYHEKSSWSFRDRKISIKEKPFTQLSATRVPPQPPWLDPSVTWWHFHKV